MMNNIESRLKELKKDVETFGGKLIDHMTIEEKKTFVDYYFNRYGHYPASSKEYKILIQKIKELGFDSLQETRKYREMKGRGK